MNLIYYWSKLIKPNGWCHRCSWRILPTAEPLNTSDMMCQVTHMSLGWHCSFRMGEGKRNLWSQSPVRTSHCDTMLSVEALTSLWPSRLQLHTRKHVTFFNSSSGSHLWRRTQLFTLKVTQIAKTESLRRESIWCGQKFFENRISYATFSHRPL